MTKDANTVDVREEKFTRVHFNCPTCKTRVAKIAHNNKAKCFHCPTRIAKTNGAWKTENQVVREGEVFNEVAPVHPSPVTIGAKETTRTERYEYRCPNCNSFNETGYNAARPYNENIQPFELCRDEKHRLIPGLFLRCGCCNLTLKKEEDSPKWVVFLAGDPKRAVRLIQEVETHEIVPIQITTLHWTCPNPDCREENKMDITDKQLPIPALICRKCRKVARKHKNVFRMTIERTRQEQVNKTGAPAQI